MKYFRQNLEFVLSSRCQILLNCDKL